MSRRTIPVLFLVLVWSVVGCSRYRYGNAGGSWNVGAQYVTADIKTLNAGIAGENVVDFLQQGGVSDQGSFWGGEFRYGMGEEVYGGGYYKMSLSGGATVTDLAGLTFNGVTFPNGTDITTKADFDIYKILVANRKVAQGSLSEFAFVFQYLDFTYNISDASNSSSWHHRAPMLLFGYEWETAASGGGGATYFAKVEWMDLGIVRVGSTGGEFTDMSIGMKWSLGGTPGAANSLIIAYRYFDSDLDIKGNKMTLKFDGPIIGLNFTF